MSGIDLLQHMERFPVRTYEVDENGHVNNSVYLGWAENLTADHVDRAGFGRDWCLQRGGAWFVRRHEITYREPARRLDEIEATVRVLSLGGVRGERRTTFRRVADGAELAEVHTEWVWVRLTDGRPMRVPDEMLEVYGSALRGA